MATPCGYQQISTLTTATSLTPPATFIPGANQSPSSCLITAETQAVRWRDDGTAPTASVGYPLTVGSELRYDGNLKAIQFIEQAVGGKINITYFY